jgi:multiple antibiotic resistance protein
MCPASTPDKRVFRACDTGGVDLRSTLLFATSLLAIMNPISSAVLFAATTGRFAAAIQRRSADQSALAILIILLVCAWAGQALLLILGITVPMLQAAGGLILLVTGLRMVMVEEGKLTQAEQDSVEDVPESHWKTLAVVPVAIPGTVGAGTITTVVVQATTYKGWTDLGIISLVCIGAAIVMWVTFRSAAPIARRLGPIGLNIATRVMGILVTATAFGLLGRGLGGLLPGLAG